MDGAKQLLDTVMNIAYPESEMPAINQVSSPYRNWKVKQYTPSLEMRLLQERAHQNQPPLLSLHAKGETPEQTADTLK